MKNIEDYLLKLLLECLTEQEYSIKKLEDKLNLIDDVGYKNNQLLGFVASCLAPPEEKFSKSHLKMTEEIIIELIRYSAELEEWGQA